MTVAAPTPARKPSRPEPQPAAAAPPAVGALLAWYDRHRRVLPWRAPPGARGDPYAVWLSEIMLQQTTVKAVVPYFLRFTAAFPTVRDLAAADLDAVLRLWAGLGYYARARNLHACARAVVERHGGVFPDNEAALRALPGIGDYTAKAVAAIAFDAPVVPVDGNVERVMTRLHAVAEALPAAKPRVKALAAALMPAPRPGDVAQALMDLGATICTPKAPACVLCPWAEPCAARRRGDPETFPRKAPKREGTLRRGAAFVAVRADGAVLARSRPPSGLLGGMTEVPTTDWSADFQTRTARDHAPMLGLGPSDWRRVPGVVTHVFTHFPLELVVLVARAPHGAEAPAGCRWIAAGDIAGAAFPNVMRKVLAHAGVAVGPAAPPSRPRRG
ncbi:Adenine DNA glycosylase [Rhodoplanes serenus]|uniref:Adenine DNA glycosylase n=1 Tax=Rhodoplanes serenus TaxID=200615 RepID=A0A3S4BK13_9BRAD|nr:A/G-specific adenine glycosylase [Rhodoplanes serenus]VCU11730.1 Adenine DNA glycosylase [Rhodoplanes serenus]